MLVLGFVVDPSWPQSLPNNWLLGQIGGLYVDQHDHVWVYNRARTMATEEAGLEGPVPGATDCCSPAKAASTSRTHVSRRTRAQPIRTARARCADEAAVERRVRELRIRAVVGVRRAEDAVKRVAEPAKVEEVALIRIE